MTKQECVFCKNFKYLSIKVIQSNLQKCITWPKKSRKGKQRWNKACMNLPKKVEYSN